MSKSTQINKRLTAKIPTPGNDVTTLGTNSVATNNLQDGSVTYEKLDPNASFRNVMVGGFQNFVDTQNLLVATTNTGTPAAGTFHSTVINRKSIVDMSQDLKPRLGIERIPTQAIYQLQDEFGPNGELVWAAQNDDKGIMRFVGAWGSAINTQGSCAITTDTNSYVEVTFYGTGLNMLGFGDTGARTQLVSIDGGAEGSNIYVQRSAVITNRYINSNQVVNLATGLTLGVHTVRIRNTVNDMRCYGFEILNETSNLRVNPGSVYISGKKLTLAAQAAVAYNSGFDSGTLGAKGGRVLVYLNSAGSLGRIVNPTNASQLLLNAADHTNEDIARSYSWREFGAGRGDDFGYLSSPRAGAFTLEDGVTSLVCSGANSYNPGSIDLLNPTNANGDFMTFTFVGTGLDIELQDSGTGGAENYTYQIDGSSAAAWAYTAGIQRKRIQKIVSGLPYGTHTFRLIRVSASVWIPGISRFIVYQPKKPTLPAGAIELADYNIMADYVSSSSVTVSATGTLRKMITREFTYLDGNTTWVTPTVSVNDLGGFYTNIANSSGSPEVRYTFFGTGIDLVADADTATATCTINIDGVNFTGTASTSVGGSWASPTWTINTGVSGSRLRISGLTLGTHVIRIIKTSTTGNFYWKGVEIITPIHSHKNSFSNWQNALPTGSTGISDNRKFTPIKESVASKKAWTQALGITVGPSTSSQSFVPVPDMLVEVETKAGEDIEVFYRVDNSGNVANDATLTQVFVDGVIVGTPASITKTLAGGAVNNMDSLLIPVSPGVHKVEVHWLTSNNTVTAITTRRILKARAV